MMAWGQEASSWDDAMDWASLERSKHVVDAESDELILTTWHDDEPLSEVFEFATRLAKHPSLKLHDQLVLHLAEQPDSERVLAPARP